MNEILCMYRYKAIEDVRSAAILAMRSGTIRGVRSGAGVYTSRKHTQTHRKIDRK